MLFVSPVRCGAGRPSRVCVLRCGVMCCFISVLAVLWFYGGGLLAAARKQAGSREILPWMIPWEAPKALQALERSELLDPMRASCWISAQHSPGKFAGCRSAFLVSCLVCAPRVFAVVASHAH